MKKLVLTLGLLLLSPFSAHGLDKCWYQTGLGWKLYVPQNAVYVYIGSNQDPVLKTINLQSLNTYLHQADGGACLVDWESFQMAFQYLGANPVLAQNLSSAGQERQRKRMDTAPSNLNLQTLLEICQSYSLEAERQICLNIVEKAAKK